MEQAQKSFAYVARDASGARQSGVVSALDTKDATRALRAQGLFPISLDVDDGTAKPGTAKRRARGKGHLTPRQTGDFLVRLAKLSSRQIQAERALAIIGDGGQDPISQAAIRMRDSLREGAPLSRALEEKAGIDDPVTLSLIKGAEVSGDMGSALTTSADIMQNRLEIRRRIVTGLTYPTILLVVALLSLGLIMIAIIPQFRPLIADRIDLVPLMGRAVFAVSGVLAGLWPIIVSALLILIGGMIIAARRGVLGRIMTSIGNRIPVIRRMLLRNQMMLLLHVLGALLSREITLSGALRVVSKSTPPGPVRQGITKVTQEVENGVALSTAMRNEKLLPRDAIEMIRIGEEAGDLGTMISRTSLDMREAADRDLERFLLLFQPALIVIVGLLIGVSLYALFSAIVSVNAITF
ncbi:type II secretion system F family protein [Cognatiyoonia sp. IB215446]|uniref:type II secretion system F family protein n=1 Tax=Cognatiyoonia sp. IB215446 TaxID=3097355 RepID=UPI002A12BF47|nr:type II secretion system F family protein [Cognatiyoonia sp. IB215446]MDX8349122.1 type II secretion system F family protein [Cognatiyoonia sp. IB215446]